MALRRRLYRVVPFLWGSPVPHEEHVRAGTVTGAVAVARATVHASSTKDSCEHGRTIHWGQKSGGNQMTTSKAIPILVTGAAGAVGSIGRNVTEMLLARGHKVRALVRREDERAEALRQLGAEVMQGDLTDLMAMHRAIEGCARVYFGMSVSADYLSATVNTAAVARHHGVEAFVNMSQMTVTQMSISESTDSPQHKLHWLAEQALSWSGLPVVTMRPTVFLDGFFRLLAAPG